MTILSYKIMRYNYFVNAFIPYVTSTAAATRYGLTSLQVAALTAFLADWNTKMGAYVNPITNGPISTNAINTAYQAGFPLTQGIRATIKNNTTITLTSEERAICNLRTPSRTNTPKGLPKSAPAFVCVEITPLGMKFLGLDPLNPFKEGKPPGIFAIGLKTAITSAGAPAPRLEQYERQENETLIDFEMLFTAAQVGETFYMIGFYINSRGEAGKDGIPFIITIM